LIQSATTRVGLPLTPLHVGGYTDVTFVTNKEEIRVRAIFALHVVVQNMIKRFGIDGRFGLLRGGNTAIQVAGKPDF